MKNILIVKHLNKKYEQKEILKDLSFDIAEGEVVCLLGPNGAGKSTTINILSGVLPFESGEINYFDQSIKNQKKEYQRHLGIVPQDIAIYEDLTAEDNVAFFASLYGIKGKELKENAEKALLRVGLLDKKKEKPKTFSGGMKRRLNIACAIAHNPKLLIMDEPTVGIDPQSRNHILMSVMEMKKEGMTIIYSTHYMEEVEQIADRLLILDLGQKIKEGFLRDIKDGYDKQVIISLKENQKINLADFYRINGIKEVKLENNQLKIASIASINNMDKIMMELVNQKIQVKNINVVENNLETIFLELTGRKLRD